MIKRVTGWERRGCAERGRDGELTMKMKAHVSSRMRGKTMGGVATITSECDEELDGCEGGALKTVRATEEVRMVTLVSK